MQSFLLSQKVPVKGAEQEQKKELAELRHVPLFWQGAEMQGSVAISHVCPSYPSGQKQAKV